MSPLPRRAAMKIAAIDVGTNSFHLLIGQVSADGQVVPIERAKDMVRLGDSAFSTGVISAEAFARAEALRSFKRLAERHHCDGIVAVATSATRRPTTAATSCAPCATRPASICRSLAVKKRPA